MKRTIKVYLGETPLLVGRLFYNVQGWRESAAFEYASQWLTYENRFAIDGTLPLISGPQYRAKSKNRSPFHGIIADSENMTLVAMCHSRRITRFTIMLYNDDFKGKFCWIWNSVFSLARLVCGLLICFTPYTSSIYYNCMSVYYLVIIIDFLHAWFWYYKQNQFCF